MSKTLTVEGLVRPGTTAEDRFQRTQQRSVRFATGQRKGTKRSRKVAAIRESQEG